MSNRRIIILFAPWVLLLAVCVISGYFSLTSSSETNITHERLKKKTKIMKTKYLGYEMTIIKQLHIDSLKQFHNKYFIFYIGSNDCGSCVYNGFEAINEVKFAIDNKFVNTISTTKYFNRKFSFIDSTMLFPNSFITMYSPVLFVLNSKLKVKDLFLFDSSVENNIDAGIKFINSYI